MAAVSETGRPAGNVIHLVSLRPGTKQPRDHGVISVANPDFTKFVDEAGKPLPWHHTMRKEKDGALVPWQPMGVSASPDGHVHVLTIAPFTVLRYTPAQVK